MTARGAMEKNRYVKVIDGKEIRGDDPNQILPPRSLEVLLESQKR